MEALFTPKTLAKREKRLGQMKTFFDKYPNFDMDSFVREKIAFCWPKLDDAISPLSDGRYLELNFNFLINKAPIDDRYEFLEKCNSPILTAIVVQDMVFGRGADLERLIKLHYQQDPITCMKQYNNIIANLLALNKFGIIDALLTWRTPPIDSLLVTEFRTPPHDEIVHYNEWDFDLSYGTLEVVAKHYNIHEFCMKFHLYQYENALLRNHSAKGHNAQRIIINKLSVKEYAEVLQSTHKWYNELLYHLIDTGIIYDPEFLSVIQYEDRRHLALLYIKPDELVNKCITPDGQSSVDFMLGILDFLFRERITEHSISLLETWGRKTGNSVRVVEAARL